MKSKIRHEIAWLCLPFVLIIGVSAWISGAQNARNAKQRQSVSGPSRVRIWGIRIASGQAKEGYRYGMRVDGHIEGAPLPSAPGQVWELQVKSARIGAGRTSKKARVVNDTSPTDGDNIPRTDVWAVIQPTKESGEMAMWIYCDSILVRPVLELELEAVQGRMKPRPSNNSTNVFIASGPRLVAPIEKIPLRNLNQNDDNANIIKSEY